MSSGEIIGKQGDKPRVSIPLPEIDIPRVRYGKNQTGGVGQGEGQVGDTVDGAEPGEGQAGDAPGEHLLEVEVTLDELAAILGRSSRCPRSRQGQEAHHGQCDDTLGHRPARGPESLRHFKAHLPRGAEAQIVERHLRPEAPGGDPGSRRQALPLLEDARREPSRQRGDHLHDGRVRLDGRRAEGDRAASRAFWIDTWLQRQYKGLETRYIIHDAVAREVDRDTFFRTRETGGTMISSAYKLCRQMIIEPTTRRTSGTSTRSTSPTATTGRRRHPHVRRAAEEQVCCRS